ncbi:formate dehydrogenase accessory protein FdhE [Symbiobacterium terraclitae]|uniref:formate dehydrogenase accessory protein FdhE n=1 Tax=Symbiobacterium terraclitae TaxID=557451 RepID=UPI0035B54ACB
MQSLEFLAAWRERARRWQEQLPEPAPLPSSAEAEAALVRGEPLVHLVDPPVDPDRFAALLTELAALYAEGRTEARPLADGLAAAPAAEQRALAEALLDGDDVTAWAARYGVEEDMLLALGGLVLQPFMASFARALRRVAPLHLWRRTRCPVCGAAPDLCRIDSDNIRHLHCPRCDTQWEHHRLTCAVCGTDDVKQVSILTLAGLEPWRVEVCDLCGGYIKTLDQRHGGHLAMPRVDLYLEDARTLQLDLLAEQEGYRRGGRAH